MYLIKLIALSVVLAALILWALACDWFTLHVLGKDPEGDGAIPPPVTGEASFYGAAYRGKRMANGERFEPERAICAAWRWPLGTFLRVEHAGKAVIVQVTDRGPNIMPRERIIDLSQSAFERLAPASRGVVKVSVQPLVDRHAEESQRAKINFRMKTEGAK